MRFAAGIGPAPGIVDTNRYAVCGRGVPVGAKARLGWPIAQIWARAAPFGIDNAGFPKLERISSVGNQGFPHLI